VWMWFGGCGSVDVVVWMWLANSRGESVKSGEVSDTRVDVVVRMWLAKTRGE
jgi:hypothetical protein